MLDLSEYTTLEADNGRQGLALLKSQRPDVVTCDISMPVMDGYQFLQAVRSDPDVAGVPVIIITAVGQEGNSTRAIELGADACLTKPFSSSHLLEVIEQLLQRSDTAG
ncbi:MAG: hypothetical protein Kow0031_27500 [Anaerolineae bacterium]